MRWNARVSGAGCVRMVRSLYREQSILLTGLVSHSHYRYPKHITGVTAKCESNRFMYNAYRVLSRVLVEPSAKVTAGRRLVGAREHGWSDKARGVHKVEILQMTYSKTSVWVRGFFTNFAGNILEVIIGRLSSYM